MATAKERAPEGLLFGMNSEMVEKVVPFLELLFAVLELADEKLRPSISVRVEELIIYIILG